MKVTKWVECSQEVEVQIGADDIRIALSEAFGAANQNLEEAVNIHDILGAFQCIGAFLLAFTQEQIDMLNAKQRATIGAFLEEQGDRFKLPGEIA